MVDRTRHVELKTGESMRVGNAVVTLLDKSGQRAKLKIVAGDDVKVEHPMKTQAVSQASRGVLLA